MLDRLDQQPPDALLTLIKLHDADTRPDKIDLGVGRLLGESVEHNGGSNAVMPARGQPAIGGLRPGFC